MSAADIRDEIERIVAEVQRPEAQDLAYYATLMSDFQALLWRPEMAHEALLAEAMGSFDRIAAAWLDGLKRHRGVQT